VLCVSGVPLVLDLILILACLGSGLMAGLFVAFSTFLMKALGSLPADEGIRTMQAINTFIVRPSFLIVFLGTAVLLLVAVYLSLGEQVSGYIIAATLSYIFMCLGSTIAFNVPLNNRLDGCDSEERKAHEFWDDYQIIWTRWNHIRSIACVTSVLLLATVLWTI